MERVVGDAAHAEYHAPVLDGAVRIGELRADDGDFGVGQSLAHYHPEPIGLIEKNVIVVPHDFPSEKDRSG
jgi:hypothetical protein